MEHISKQFFYLKNHVNQNQIYLDIGCSFIGNILDGVYLIFEKCNASEIDISTLLNLIKKYIDIEIVEEELLTAQNIIKNMFAVDKMQIFAIDVLNKNKVKFYFFEKKLPFLIGNDLDILKKNFDYGEVSYDPTFFQDKFLCFGFTIDLSKEHFIENYKVYYKVVGNESTGPYIQMFSAKKFTGFEQYNYHLCQNGLSFYKFIKNTYGIDTFKDLPSITNNYSLSEIQISENPLANKKINLYYFDVENEFSN